MPVLGSSTSVESALALRTCHTLFRHPVALIQRPGLQRGSLIWPRFHPDLNDTKIALTTEFRSALGLVEYVDEARSCSADGIAVPYQLIDRRQVNAARSAGLNVQVWTPNSPELLEEYCKWPVSALITDYPELVPCLAGGEK